MSIAPEATTADGGDDRLAGVWRAANVVPLWLNQAAHRNQIDKGEPACIWRWSELQTAIAAAIDMRSMEATERRVLSLVSPHAQVIGGAAGTTTNLNAGLQILMPGERARPHRHSMNALRFVLAGAGATTIVDGKPCPMSEGDLVTTPGWCWHEHVHGGGGAIIWLDVLDASLHRYLGSDVFEPGPVGDLPTWASDAAFKFGGMVPETGHKAKAFSPVFRYPWQDAAAALSLAPRGADGARRVRYANPLDGGPVMSLMDCGLLEVAAGRATTPMRSSANAVCAVVEGEGISEIGGESFAWGPRDVFSIPHGNWVTHRAGSQSARLFVVSDRPVLQRLGLLVEEDGVSG